MKCPICRSGEDRKLCPALIPYKYRSAFMNKSESMNMDLNTSDTDDGDEEYTEDSSDDESYLNGLSLYDVFLHNFLHSDITIQFEIMNKNRQIFSRAEARAAPQVPQMENQLLLNSEIIEYNVQHQFKRKFTKALKNAMLFEEMEVRFGVCHFNFPEMLWTPSLPCSSKFTNTLYISGTDNHSRTPCGDIDVQDTEINVTIHSNCFEYLISNYTPWTLNI